MLSRAFLLILTAVATPAAAAPPEAKQSAEPPRQSIVRIVDQIKRADYEGDRVALQRLHDELPTSAADKSFASRVLYWRGFALWRRAINGFNETPTPTDLETDLNAGIADFQNAIAQDSGNVEPKIGAASSLGYLMYLNHKDQARAQELLQRVIPLTKELQAEAADNPRFLWIMGPVRWATPPERGGGQDKAFELYNRGLEIVRKPKPQSDPLEPSWGEPELLMNRAWSNLNRTTPDLKAAAEDAQAALQLVPYWHYVRDILIPQIKTAQAKAH